MNENTAKSLVTSLINAAYEAGMWKNDPNQMMEPHWKEKAEKIGDEIIYRLSNQSSGQETPVIATCSKCGLEHRSHMAAANCCR